MTLLDFTQLPDNHYDASLSLTAARGFHGAAPVADDAAPDPRILEAVAFCLTRGISDKRSVSVQRGWVVLGSEEWTKPENKAVDSLSVPLADPRMGRLTNCRMDEDLQGFVLFYQRGKVRKRFCVVCEQAFETKRERSARSRWPEVCGDDCKKARDAARKRAARRRDG